MKVCFLDIDGVLLPIASRTDLCEYCGKGVSEGAVFALFEISSAPRCVACCDSRGTPYSGTADDFRDSCVAALNQILRTTGAEVTDPVGAQIFLSLIVLVSL